MLNRDSLKAMTSGTRDERVYLASKDFSLFFVYYFVDYIKYKFAPFHFEMFEDLEKLMEGEYREIAWIMFRESAKTSISKAFVTWLIIFDKKKYINVDSFDKENAERILFDVVVELQTNKKIIADFGQLFNQKRQDGEKTQKRVNNFVANNGVRVEAHSTQESVRGRLHGHQRPDFLLLDDFETNKTKDSKAYTEQVIKHINEFKSGLAGDANVIYLGNYITELGSVQTLFDRAKIDKRLKIRKVDAIIEGKPAWGDKYTMTDEESKGTKKISLEDKKKQLGSVVFSAEMMNNPINVESQKFFKKFFKYKTRDYVERLNKRMFVIYDTAISNTDGSDYTGRVEIYVDEQNNWYVSGRQWKINPKQIIDFFFKDLDNGAEKIGVETTAFTEALEPFLKDEMAKRNRYPYIIQLKHGGRKKEMRIEGLIPKYEAGQIYHIEGECDDMEEQLIRFPRGIHDDIIDAEAYGLQLCEPAYEEEDFIQEDDCLYDDIGV